MGLGFLLWLWWFKAWAVVELVHLDFLVEVVVVLRSAGGGGGCGCGFLGLLLVVVELG